MCLDPQMVLILFLHEDHLCRVEVVDVLPPLLVWQVHLDLVHGGPVVFELVWLIILFEAGVLVNVVDETLWVSHVPIVIVIAVVVIIVVVAVVVDDVLVVMLMLLIWHVPSFRVELIDPTPVLLLLIDITHVGHMRSIRIHAIILRGVLLGGLSLA